MSGAGAWWEDLDLPRGHTLRRTGAWFNALQSLLWNGSQIWTRGPWFHFALGPVNDAAIPGTWVNVLSMVGRGVKVLRGPLALPTAYMPWVRSLSSLASVYSPLNWGCDRTYFIIPKPLWAQSSLLCLSPVMACTCQLPFWLFFFLFVAVSVKQLREKNPVQIGKSPAQPALNSPSCMCKSDKNDQWLKVTFYTFNEITDLTGWLYTF